MASPQYLTVRRFGRWLWSRQDHQVELDNASGGGILFSFCFLPVLQRNFHSFEGFNDVWGKRNGKRRTASVGYNHIATTWYEFECPRR